MSFNEEQSTIMSLVSKFGCVSMQQFYDLLPEQVKKVPKTRKMPNKKGNKIDFREVPQKHFFS